MSLLNAPLHATLAVSDIDKAREFYEQTLGFTPDSVNPGGVFYTAGKGTRFLLYPSGEAGSNRLTGTVEDVNFLGSIVRIRVRLGEEAGGEPPSIVALDSFNEPHLKVPDVGQPVTISFPPEASFVLGAARDEAATPSSEVGAEV